jgi:hypothetical protein
MGTPYQLGDEESRKDILDRIGAGKEDFVKTLFARESRLGVGRGDCVPVDRLLDFYSK